MAAEQKLRDAVSRHIALLETLPYVAVGVLPIAAAAVFHAGEALWAGIAGGSGADAGLLALDQMLLASPSRPAP